MADVEPCRFWTMKWATCISMLSESAVSSPPPPLPLPVVPLSSKKGSSKGPSYPSCWLMKEVRFSISGVSRKAHCIRKLSVEVEQHVAHADEVVGPRLVDDGT